jgi:hypothetical protein
MRALRHAAVIVPGLIFLLGMYLFFYACWAGAQDDSGVLWWAKSALAGLILAAAGLIVAGAAIAWRLRLSRRGRSI